ncbi:site-specific integrase [Polaribacter undariae]|uniref:Site-specific integrase n=1 Tax=Polaribacter sejongensis TaxID=985043 RepID=A0AAJ1QWG7_9FLAO|nr:site-specific integrase [Polaribacter undariae]MDN3619405.1 site-specific integrase [Polaribacter undariae]UWD33395.1 site-specific integrase [Polaribacter undariae]
MNYSFRLKYPNLDKESLIYFTASFKDEGKTFVYSTGEKIHPKDWDFDNKRPTNLSGRKKDAELRRVIDTQLSRYSNFFIELISRYKTINENLTIETTKDEFNVEFKKVNKNVSDFFKVYELFLEDKRDDNSDQANTTSTISRYEYNKKLLEDFQNHKSYNLRFNTINRKFYNAFISYCVEIKKHSANTLSRNIGLFKTFMNWAIAKKFTYNDEFKKFKNIKRFKTDEIALTKEQVDEIYEFDLEGDKKLERVRDLFVFGCSTGMRYSNYSKVKKNDIIDGFINVIDEKDKSKSLSIPTNRYSIEILEKYDYKLPKISNQKFNEYLKELFQAMKYNHIVKKTMRYGNEIIETESPFSERISSHTSRRSFITIMKNEGVPDKVIMSYTGHKSIEVFNNYYRPNQEHRINFMQNVWQ